MGLSAKDLYSLLSLVSSPTRQALPLVCRWMSHTDLRIRQFGLTLAAEGPLLITPSHTLPLPLLFLPLPLPLTRTLTLTFSLPLLLPLPTTSPRGRP